MKIGIGKNAPMLFPQLAKVVMVKLHQYAPTLFAQLMNIAISKNAPILLAQLMKVAIGKTTPIFFANLSLVKIYQFYALLFAKLGKFASFLQQFRPKYPNRLFAHIP